MRSVRLLASILLVTWAASVVLAQSPLPAPESSRPRGAYSPSAPYFVPGGIEARGTTFVVTTTTDESDGGCDSGIGDGLSLREALVDCPTVDANGIVYIPAGTYSVGDEIDSAFANVTLIGEDPLTTIIENEIRVPRANDHIFSFALLAEYVSISNLTLRNAAGAGTADLGAIEVIGGGWLTFHNLILSGNTALTGPALSMTGGPYILSMSNLTVTGNQAQRDGGAFYILTSSPSVQTIITIADSTFTSNSAGSVGCDFGGGGAMLYDLQGGANQTTFDNVLFDGNSIACDGFEGGAVRYLDSDQFDTLIVRDSEFVDNSALGQFSDGGGLWFGATQGNLQILNTVFSGNSAGRGGGLLQLGTGALTIRDSTFDANTATLDGGGLYAEAPALLENTVVIGNQTFGIDNAVGADSPAVGAGAYFKGGATILDSVFTLNAAGSALIPGSQAGGAYFDTLGAFVRGTAFEDNSADSSPDCYNTITDTPADAATVSLGGNIFTSTFGCGIPLDSTDLYDNLILNGGFEESDTSEKDAAYWSEELLTGEKRECNSTTKSVAVYGRCAYKLTGAAGEASYIQQNVDLLAHTFSTNEELTLYAEANGVSTTIVKVQVKATYTDPLIPKGKAKFTFNGVGLTDGFDALTDSFPLASGTMTKLQVKITNTSTSGKLYLDRVFLFVSSVAPSRAAVPPPAAPAAFRGGS
ncbi:MAG: hypothetical protein IPK52_23360 [Chloroflexi bacterium]|nr:hypothetical protein [Chloroflexota bacterium]